MARSLLDLLQMIPDPRGRRGRVYPLYGLLAVLILAAMHGENSLLGMWEWAKEREARLVNQVALGLWGRPHLPCLGTFWYALCHLDVGALERVLREWVAGWGEEQAYALDGKTLRGSKRQRGEGALQLLTMAGQHLRGIVGQYRVEGQDELEAALRMIEEIPLAGKVVSADAGLLRAPLAQKVVEKGGPTLGSSRRTSPS
jgi:hypothetical protein